MPSLGGLIGGVMGGAAKGYTDYAKQRLDVDLKKELMAAEEEKLLRIDEIKRQRDIKDIAPRAEATAAAAPVLAAGEAAAAPIRATGEAAAAPIKAGADAASQVIKTNTPGYIESVGKEASAKESSGSKAQARLANMSIAEKEEVTALLKEYDNPATKPERKAQIKDALTVRGIIKPGEFDTEKVITESMDDQGNVVKTERVQRRNSNSAPKGDTGPKEGDTATSKSGKPIVFRNGRWEYQ